MIFFALLRGKRKQCNIQHLKRSEIFQQWSSSLVGIVTWWRSSMPWPSYLGLLYLCFIQTVCSHNTTNNYLERALVRIGFFIPVSAPSSEYASHFRSARFATFCLSSKCDFVFCQIDRFYQEARRSIPCPSFWRR